MATGANVNAKNVSGRGREPFPLMGWQVAGQNHVRQQAAGLRNSHGGGRGRVPSPTHPAWPALQTRGLRDKCRPCGTQWCGTQCSRLGVRGAGAHMRAERAVRRVKPGRAMRFERGALI